MHLLVVSPDADVEKRCREVLTEFVGLDWHLTSAATGASAPAADMYIWDSPTRADVRWALEQRRSARHLFLVPRDDTAAIRDALGTTDAAFLLKPVTRACPSAFLTFATSAWRAGPSPGSLRADRDEMLQCLIQLNLQVQEYDQERTNFLARAVHDFRTPLTAAGGYCGLLLSDALGPTTEEQKEVLRRMQHSIKRLSRMAAAMFELSVTRHVK